MRNREDNVNQSGAAPGPDAAGRLKSALSLLKRDIKENLLGLAVMTAYIIVFQLLFKTVCPMQLLFGLPCPGCGLTRALRLFLTGHFIAAFKMHPFLYAWMFVAVYWAFFRYILQKKSRYLVFLMAAVLCGMLILYIYRMACFYPDTEPVNPLLKGIVPMLIHKNLSVQ